MVVRLGAAKIDRTAHRVGMRRFHLDRAIWGRSLITAREESRFFLHIDARLPPRHRAWGMELLRTVVPKQRWGIGEVDPARVDGLLQGRLGERHRAGRPPGRAAHPRPGARSVAVLTITDGTHEAGKATLRGVFARLLRGLAESA